MPIVITETGKRVAAFGPKWTLNVYNLEKHEDDSQEACLERSLLSLLLFLIGSSAHAAAPAPPKLAFRPNVNAPLQQSKCEVRSNKVMAAHPHLDMFKLMNRYGVFLFGEKRPFIGTMLVPSQSASQVVPALSQRFIEARQ